MPWNADFKLMWWSMDDALKAVREGRFLPQVGARRAAAGRGPPATVCPQGFSANEVFSGAETRHPRPDGGEGCRCVRQAPGRAASSMRPSVAGVSVFRAVM
ncbi:hypothetical protein GCM10010339_09920 [Streptomyces alanosinicus]|uniref:Uncharacterized protein n=1 Tax=Streptomyces alanosinicus TaxID=68171 RepID=A0A918YCW0_9ACTN|nr:hypothetical protein GCM10010339_09920 [Streptomyces alanosinicus]